MQAFQYTLALHFSSSWSAPSLLRRFFRNAPSSLVLNQQSQVSTFWRSKQLVSRAVVATVAESMRGSPFQLEEKQRKEKLEEVRAFTTNVTVQQDAANHGAYSDPNTGMERSPPESMPTTCQGSDNTVRNEEESVFPFVDTDVTESAFLGNNFRTVSKRDNNSISILPGTLESVGTGAKTFSASVQVDAPLIKFVNGKGGKMKESIEKETDTHLLIPAPHEVKNGSCLVIEGFSQEAVDAAVTRVHNVLHEAVRSHSLDYSHFISLPLGVHAAIVDQLTKFQESVLDLTNSVSKEVGQQNTDAMEDIKTMVEEETEKETQVETMPFENDEGPDKVSVDELEPDKETQYVEYVLETETRTNNSWGIDRSIFVKPATFHLTVLMLKLWNNDRLTAAADTLQRCKPKVHEALEGRPIAVRVRGLECMRGSPAKAHVLYACVEEADQGNRLARACQVIIDEFVAAGLVLEANSMQSLKLHATLMNTRQRKMKRGKRFKKRIPFDARQILLQHGSLDFGEHFILEAQLSQRFSYGENGYYQPAGSIELPTVTL